MGLTTWLHAHWKKVYHPTLYPPTYPDRHAGRPALILGSGASVLDHGTPLVNLVLDHKPVTFTTNRPKVELAGFPLFPDYAGFINRKRFCAYANHTHPRTRILIGPHIPERTVKQIVPPMIRWERLPYRNITAPFHIQDGVIQCDCGDVGMTLIVVAALMGCSPLWVAGVDGYPDRPVAHAYQETDWQLEGALAHQRRVMQVLPQVQEWCRTSRVDGPHWLTPTVYPGVYGGFPGR